LKARSHNKLCINVTFLASIAIDKWIGISFFYLVELSCFTFLQFSYTMCDMTFLIFKGVERWFVDELGFIHVVWLNIERTYVIVKTWKGVSIEDLISCIHICFLLNKAILFYSCERILISLLSLHIFHM
jgi:hypothetical protein